MDIEIDFDKVDEASSFDPIPEEWYLSQLAEVEETTTKAGDPMWKLKWEIIQGEFEGRFVWDNLVFVEKAYGRVKLLLRRCGVDTTGRIKVVPAMIEGKTVKLFAEINEYVDDQGKTKRNNKVSFDGYDYPDSTAPADTAADREAETTAEPAPDDVPF